MSAGITRVHGIAIMPSQRPSTLSFFNVSTSTNLISAEYTNAPANGVFDVMFRTGVTKFATVALIGTPVYANGATTLNFAIEDTGTLNTTPQVSPSGLGLGSSEGQSYDTVAHALQAAIRAIGSSNYNGFDMSAMVVAAGVAATSSVTL